MLTNATELTSPAEIEALRAALAEIAASAKETVHA